MMAAKKAIIGRNALVDFGDEVLGVPAKVDTGADSSAVWASDIFVDKEHVGGLGLVCDFGAIDSRIDEELYFEVEVSDNEE